MEYLKKEQALYGAELTTRQQESSKQHITTPVYANPPRRFVSMSLSLILFLFTLPLFSFIALAIKLKDGGPLFYMGQRLGINKIPFAMYKFRTLPKGASNILGCEVLSYKHHMTTPFTRFLRDTRLDELPQLFNIMKGDMDFFGPRPVRPKMYEEVCRHVKGFDNRFKVRPGLIGFSQLFTPHGCPKRLRVLIDNRYTFKKKNALQDIRLLGFTIMVITREICVKGLIHLWNNRIQTKILKRYIEKRYLVRRRVTGTEVHIQASRDRHLGDPQAVTLIDINEDYFKIMTKTELFKNSGIFRLEKRTRSKHKTAVCRGEIVAKREKESSQGKYVYVVRYEALSDMYQYMIDKYFLGKSIA